MNKLINDYLISCGSPYPLGASVVNDNTVNFAVAIDECDSCGLIIYDKDSNKSVRIPFEQCNRIGKIYCISVSCIEPQKIYYNFYVDDQVITDPYSRIIVGNNNWGKIPAELKAAIYFDDFEWDNDTNPMIPFNESIFYLLHPRGFTKHKSSMVSQPGTFQGIIDKISYLKQLGITTVELMPAYNFVELVAKEKPKNEFDSGLYDNYEPKLNYWGYKEGYYFAPKSSYSYDCENVVNCFKELVKQLHSNNMELIMQFFFPETVKQGYVFEVLKFWMKEYHVDGFHLMGSKLPLALIATDPLLATTKIIYEGFPLDEIYDYSYCPKYMNLAVCKDEYMYDMRRLLKSDEGMVGKALEYIKSSPLKTGAVHYITFGNTFTLMDLVSFDRKHNEDNGENNRDGAVYNGSWNCGFEGSTTRKSVKNLRIKQIKNAIIFNLLSKTTPLIVAGDEFGNSQKGNNNPYCQDNAISWLNWKDADKNKEILEFTRQIIEFRRNHKILHMEDSFKMSDYKQYGYPDLSFHSEEAWRVNADPLSRQFGLLYNGKYADEDCFIYVAVNMHWTNHSFAIPKINGLTKWEMIVDTDITNHSIFDKDDISHINVKERSIVILLGKIK